MSTITPTVTRDRNHHALIAKWIGFAASADVGAALQGENFLDRTVQVLGTFTGGGEITMEGSLDGGTTYATLHDPQGNTLVFTAAGTKYVTEVTDLIRPRATAGSGGAAIDVYVRLGGAGK